MQGGGSHGGKGCSFPGASSLCDTITGVVRGHLVVCCVDCNGVEPGRLTQPGRRCIVTTQSAKSYDEFLSTFRVEDLAARFAGDFETGLNACYECCDRYAGSNKVALYWEDKESRSATYTFDALQVLGARFANFLREQGIGPGGRVAALLPRIPELFVVVLGTWRAGAVYQTLFTAFGPKAIEYRLERSGANLVVTDLANRPKLEGIAGVPQVLTVTGEGATPPDGDLHFLHEVNRPRASLAPVLLKGDDPFLLLFTSGTVGLAKGVAVTLYTFLLEWTPNLVGASLPC